MGILKKNDFQLIKSNDVAHVNYSCKDNLMLDTVSFTTSILSMVAQLLALIDYTVGLECAILGIFMSLTWL